MLFMSSVITEAVLVEILYRGKEETWQLTNVQESIIVGILKITDSNFLIEVNFV